MKNLTINEYANLKANEAFNIISNVSLVTKENYREVLDFFNLNISYIKDSELLASFKSSILEEEDTIYEENELNEYFINSILRNKFLEEFKNLI